MHDATVSALHHLNREATYTEHATVNGTKNVLILLVIINLHVGPVLFPGNFTWSVCVKKNIFFLSESKKITLSGK